MHSASEIEAEQLIRNLFVSAESRDTYFNEKHSLIVSPDFLKILLKDAIIWSKDKKSALLSRTAVYFKAEPLNTLVLARRDTNSNSTLHQVVSFIMRILSQESDVQKLVSAVKVFLPYYQLTISHLKQLTQHMGRDFHMQKLNWPRFLIVIQTLTTFYESRQITRSQPLSFFYFYGKDSGIKARCSGVKWPFLSNIGFMACFESRPSPVTERTYLFHITTTLGETIALCVQNQVLCLQVNSDIINLIQVQNFTWYPVQFEYNLEYGRIQLTLEDTMVAKQQLKTFPTDPTRRLTQIIIGKDFYGRINSPMMFSGPLPKDQAFKTNPYGLQNWEKVILFREKNYFSECLLAYFPFSTTHQNQQQLCFDPINRCDAQLMSNCCTFYNKTHNGGIGVLGGLRMILPIIYLGQYFRDVHSSTNVAEALLNLTMTPFRLKLQGLESDVLKCNFFGVISHHMWQYDPSLFTLKYVRLIRDFKTTLRQPKLKQEFFRKVLWGLPVHKLKDSECVDFYYKTILLSYQTNQSFYEECYPLESVLYYMSLNLQGDTFTCCLQHHLNESLLTNDPLPTYVHSQYPLHLKAIKPIVQLLIGNNLRDDYKKGIQQVKSLLRLFLNKGSACFYLNLLQILKTLLNMEDHKNAEAAIIVKECNIVSNLFHLAEKNINPDVVAQLIDILLFLQSRFSASVDPDKTISFICLLFAKFPANLRQPNAKLKKKLSGNTATKVQDHSSEEQSLVAEIRQLAGLSPQTIASNNVIYPILKKYYYGKPSKDIEGGLISNQQAVRLVCYYYKMTTNQTKQVILVDFLSELSFSTRNLGFFSSSLVFVSFITEIIDGQGPKKSIILELATKIGVRILEDKVTSNNARQFYVSLRAVVGFHQRQSSCFCIILNQYLKRLNRKGGETLHNLSQVCLIIFFQVKRTLRSIGPEGRGSISKVTGVLLTFVYEQCCQQFNFIQQDDFQSKFFPNILQEKPGNTLIAFFTAEPYRQQVNEGDIYVIFDNLISKSQFDTKFKIQSILKKNLYVIEMILQLLFVFIQKSLMQETFHTQYYLNILVKLVVLFLCLLTNQSKHDITLEKNVLGRKIFFQCCHFLSKMSQQPYHQDHFTKARNTLVTFVFEYIDYLDRMLGRHTSLASLLKRIQELKQIRYNPYLVELFQFFLRNESNKPIVTLGQITEMVRINPLPIDSILQGGFLWTFTRPSLDNLKVALEQKDQVYVTGQIQSEITDKLAELEFILPLTNYEDQIAEGILSNFDKQNPKEERSRLRYVQRVQEALRRVSSDWRKLWTLLRIYHMPYSIWMNQRDSDLKDNLRNNPMKNYRSKVSKYLSKSGSRPILTARIIQPKNMVKPQQHPITQPRMLSLNSSPSRAIKQSNFKRIFMREKEEGQFLEFKVTWIKESVHIKGTLSIYEEYLVFSYQSANQKDIHTSFSSFQLQLWEQLHKKWLFLDILNVVRKRYLLQHIALEIVLTSMKSVLFAFQEAKIEMFIQQVIRIRKGLLSKYKDKMVLNKVAFCTKEFLIGLPQENLLKSQVTQSWRLNKISTFEYLTKLNFLSCRSYNDYSQYPVFPWIIEAVSGKSPKFRDLSKNMGSLGTPERVQTYINKYKSNDPFSTTPPYFFGTHYSSPGVLFNYLIRLLPFTQCAKQLQGGKFDLADRMFFSLESSWSSATKQISDVRELIPEYYYLPEMFQNLDGQRLGVMQSGQRVDDVQLPQWAANAYHLVIQLRQMLESPEVSQRINNWIDLIFGYKQKGKEGQDQMNIFYHLTYQNAVNLQAIQDQVTRTSYQAQIIHFGQCPSQLFQKPHPKRQPISKQPLQLKCIQNVKLSSKEFAQRRVGFHLGETNVSILYQHKLVTYSRFKQVCSNRTVQEIEYHRHKCGIHLLSTEQTISVFFGEGKFLVMAGYLDGSYRVYKTSPMQIIRTGQALAQVSSVLVTENQDMILLGTLIGTLEVVELQYQSLNSVNISTIHVQYLQGRVSHISQNQGFICVCFQDMVSIYRITRSLDYLLFHHRQPQVKFFRSFKNKIKVNGAVIVESPLFSVVLFDNLGLKCYSINGKLITTLPTSTSVQRVNTLKDPSLHDVIVLHDDNRLLCVSTPDLRRLSYIDVRRQDLDGLNLLRGDLVKVLGFDFESGFKLSHT